MRTPTRRSAVLLATAAALIGGSSAAAPKKAAPDSGITVGRAGAPVTVTEYASVTCGHCAAWDAEVWPAFKAKYVDTGLVRYELKEMLTAPAELSAAGWMLARCAAPARSLGVVKAFYRSQGELEAAADVRPILLRIGREAGLTNAQTNRCLNDKAALAALNKRVEAAAAQGVDGTPAFYINGRKHEGDISLAGLDEALRPLLARRR